MGGVNLTYARASAPQRGNDRGAAVPGARRGPLARVLAHLEPHPFWRTYVYLGCVTGMRPGELRALRWEDIDEAAGVVRVRRNVQRGRVMAGGRSSPAQVGPTKSGVERAAPLAPETADLMRAHRRWLVETQAPGVESGLVFPSPRHGGHLSPMADRDMFRRVSEALGLPPLSPKCMRRTYMDLARAAGVAGIVVRSIRAGTYLTTKVKPGKSACL